MAAPLDGDVVQLAGMGSALGLLAFDKRQTLNIHVRTKSEKDFIERLMNLTSRLGTVRLVGEHGFNKSIPGAECLSIPPWNQRNSLEGLELPSAIGPTKALKSEAIEIARLVLDRQHATIAVPAE